MKKQIVIIHGGNILDIKDNFLTYLNKKKVTKDDFKSKKGWKDDFEEKLGDEFENYQMINVDDFLEACSSLKALPGMTKYHFTGRAYKFLGINFLPAFEDLKLKRKMEMYLIDNK